MTKIELSFDMFSAYSYLAFVQLTQCQGKCKSKFELVYTPVNLMMLFKESGNVAPILCGNKKKYIGVDLKREFKRHNVDYNEDMKNFQKVMMNSAINANYLVLHAINSKFDKLEELIKTIWDKFVAKSVDISDISELQKIANEVGFLQNESLNDIIKKGDLDKQLTENTKRICQLG
ncbi:hypothetical protein A3Q56_08348, partial [Intoshia linei]